jgi:hypothetical protein
MLAGARGVPGADLAVVPERKAAIAAAAAGTSSRDVICVIGRGNVVESISNTREDDRDAMRRLTQSDSAPSSPERTSQAALGKLAV